MCSKTFGMRPDETDGPGRVKFVRNIFDFEMILNMGKLLESVMTLNVI